MFLHPSRRLVLELTSSRQSYHTHRLRQQGEATPAPEILPYALRNPGRHPAQEAGLVPRPLAEIQALAAAKRANAKAIQDAKAAEARAHAAEHAKNRDRLAAL